MADNRFFKGNENRNAFVSGKPADRPQPDGGKIPADGGAWEEPAKAADAFVEEGQKEYRPRHQAESRLAGKPVRIAVIAALVLLLAFAGGMAWALFGYTGVYPGVRVLGVSGVGLSEQELASRVAQAEQEVFSGKELPLRINEADYSIKADDAGIDVDEQAAAKAAFVYGREGDLLHRAGSILKALFGGHSVKLPVTLDEKGINAKVQEIARKASEGYADPSYQIIDGILYIDTGSEGLMVDPEEIYPMVKERFSEADFSQLSFQLVLDRPDELNLEAILTELAAAKKNARLDLEADPKGGVILPHTDGVIFDVPSALELYRNRKGRYVGIPCQYDPADVTAEMLAANLFRDALADVTTTLNANLVGRTTNVRLAVGFIDGTILNPGDEFSYNKVVGPRTVERGFKDAKIFQKGEIVDGIGGGICQVSTTLYMSALRSNLKITERRNHRFRVAYAPLGEDATVVYGSTDFRFVNDSLYPIKITAVQEKNNVRITLYGTKTDDHTVKLVTTVLEKKPYEKITVEDENLDYGQTKVETEGYTGYKTVTYRVIEDADGKEVSRVKENESTYVKLDEVIRVGVRGKPVVEPLPGDPSAPVVTPPAQPADPAVPADPTVPPADPNVPPPTPPPTY